MSASSSLTQALLANQRLNAKKSKKANLDAYWAANAEAIAKKKAKVKK